MGCPPAARAACRPYLLTTRSDYPTHQGQQAHETRSRMTRVGESRGKDPLRRVFVSQALTQNGGGSGGNLKKCCKWLICKNFSAPMSCGGSTSRGGGSGGKHQGYLSTVMHSSAVHG